MKTDGRVLATGLLLVWAFASCGGDAGATGGGTESPRAPFRGPPVNLGGCGSPRPPAPISEDFPDDIALPEGARSIEPEFDLPNGIRVDLHVPGEVKPIQRFFKASLKDTGRRIVALDYEGWEAEVYFSESDGRPGLVQLRAACSGGTTVSIEIFDLPSDA
jgi:hypothetical protein